MIPLPFFCCEKLHAVFGRRFIRGEIWFLSLGGQMGRAPRKPQLNRIGEWTIDACHCLQTLVKHECFRWAFQRGVPVKATRDGKLGSKRAMNFRTTFEWIVVRLKCFEMFWKFPDFCCHVWCLNLIFVTGLRFSFEGDAFKVRIFVWSCVVYCSYKEFPVDDGDSSRRGVQKWYLVPGNRVFCFFNCNRRIWRLILKSWGLWRKRKSSSLCFQGTLSTMLQPHVRFFFFALLCQDSFRMSSRPTSATGTAPTPSHHPPMLSARVEDFRVGCWSWGAGHLYANELQW